MIISICNTKGGAGKSTIAFNLAVTRARSGKKVWLIDGDEQGTVAQSMLQRKSSGKKPDIKTDHLPDGIKLKNSVISMSSNYDDVIIDSAGFDSKSLRAAILVSDKIITPFKASSADVWALINLNKIIKDSGREIKALAFINLLESRGGEQIAAESALEDFSHIEYLNCPIYRRKAFIDALGEGFSVAELKKKDEKAIYELYRLTKRVFGDN